MSWCERLFGRTVERCDGDGKVSAVSTSEALRECHGENQPEIAVLFTNNASSNGDDLIKRVSNLQAHLNTSSPRPRVVVVQAGGASMPQGLDYWFRVQEGEVVHCLVRKLKVPRTGGGAFILLARNDLRNPSFKHSPQQAVQRARHVKDDLMADPDGKKFPWTPLTVQEVLENIPLVRCGDVIQDQTSAQQVLDTKEPYFYTQLPNEAIRGFYFAAHWCPPCRAFTPQLAALYNSVAKKTRHKDFQIIFSSSDRSYESYCRAVRGMPPSWLTIPWRNTSCAKIDTDLSTRLAAALGVTAIPALFLVDSEGCVVCDGRHNITNDPDGLNFPWIVKPVNVLTEYVLLSRLAEHPAVILFIDSDEAELEFAELVLTPSAESYYEECAIQYPGFCPYQTSSDDELDYETIGISSKSSTRKFKRKAFKHMMFMVGLDGTDQVEILRDHVGLDDAVPLLTCIDFPKNRMAVMKYGDEITTSSVQNFVDNYLSGNVEYQAIKPFSNTK